MMRILSRPRDERGAVAIMVAALTIVLFGIAALSVDIASQVQRKHLLKNQLDAAATAAAFYLDQDTDGIKSAVTKAKEYFTKNGDGDDELEDAKIDFWCVVAQKPGTTDANAQVANYQIPSTSGMAGVCNPDASSSTTTWMKSQYQNQIRQSDGRVFKMSCNGTLCAVPCALKAQAPNWQPGNSTYNSAPITCNTIRVGAEEGVPFSFAPAIGIDQGSTGAQIAVACKGSCGTIAPNPMDVVVVADRTNSMSMNSSGRQCTTGTYGCYNYRVDLAAGIESMLKVMTPEQQYVALAALGPSAKTRTNSLSSACNSSNQGLVWPSTKEYVRRSGDASATGSWVPIKFHSDYLSGVDVSGNPTVNSTSKLVQAIRCLDDTDTNTNTSLASPLKSAARFLLGKAGDTNNIADLGGADRNGDIKKVIIFETDGQPREITASTTGSLTLDDPYDIFSNTTSYTASAPTSVGPVNGTPTTACNNNDSCRPTLSSTNSTRVTPPNRCSRSGSSCKYSYRYATTNVAQNYVRYGGQQACRNFENVAQLAKNEGILIITVGYAMANKKCADLNVSDGIPEDEGTTTVDTTPYISGISPTSCIQSGSGTQSSPYVAKDTSACQTMTVTWTVPRTIRQVTIADRGDNSSVADVLATAAGGTDITPSASNGCSTTALRTAENGDGDFFFCAAQGDDLAPIFTTALSQVSKGVKLMNLP